MKTIFILLFVTSCWNDSDCDCGTIIDKGDRWVMLATDCGGDTLVFNDTTFNIGDAACKSDFTLSLMEK